MKTICKRCGLFDRTKDNACRPCHLDSSRRVWAKYKDRYKETRRLYRLTPKGKAASLWNSIKWRANNKANNPKSGCYNSIDLRMSRDEFINWAIAELTNWQISNGNLNEVSIDRIDGSGHYELNNIHLTTKLANYRKSIQHKNVSAPEGLAWCGKCKGYLTTDNFHKNKTRFNGLEQVCKEHKRQEYYVKRYGKQES